MLPLLGAQGIIADTVMAWTWCSSHGGRWPGALFPQRAQVQTMVPQGLVCWQIHKQAPPLEDIAGDCSPSMRDLIEAALERNPKHRPQAADLLKHEALNPPREDQPRCQSLDSALFERKRLLSRKELELPENITGKKTPCCGWCSCLPVFCPQTFGVLQESAGEEGK